MIDRPFDCFHKNNAVKVFVRLVKYAKFNEIRSINERLCPSVKF